MKTITYTIKLDPAQLALTEQWFEALRRVWNQALELILECDRYSTWNKYDKTRYPSMPIFGGVDKDGIVIAPWKYRFIPANGATKSKKAKKKTDKPLEPVEPAAKIKWVPVPYTPCTSFDSYRRPYRPCCPLPLPYVEPRLDRPSAFSLSAMFSQKANPEWAELQKVPSVFVRGTLASLAIAWKEHKSGRMGEPRFKGIRNGLSTLVSNDAKSIKVKDGQIRVPGLGLIVMPESAKVWTDVEICVLKVCNLPGFWQLQLTGELPKVELKPSDRKCSLEFPRVENLLYRDDKGKEVKPFENLKLSKQLEKLQLKLAEKQSVRQNRSNKLGLHIPQSKNELELRKQIKRVEWKIAKGADQHAHKLSTFIVRTYGEIELQPAKTKPIPKPEPIPIDVEPAVYAPNGAERVARFNKKVTRLRTGRLRALLKQKAADGDRILAEP